MRVVNTEDLGLLVRDERRRRGLSQASLCTAAEVSRRWLSDFEAGKATAEIGLVFRVLHALDLIMEVAERGQTDFDLDDIIRVQGGG